MVVYHKDRDWFVQIEFVNGCFVFRNGWNQFVQDNKLVFGDVLVFSPINHIEWTFVYVRDSPDIGDMVLDAVVCYPTLTYLVSVFIVIFKLYKESTICFIKYICG